MKFKIFIASIERNKKRVSDVQKALKENGFLEDEYEVFFGTDYKKVNPLVLNKIRSAFGIYTPKAAIACAHTHIKLWKHIYENYNDLDFCVILEDDACLIKEEFDKIKEDINLFLSTKENIFLNNTTNFYLKKKNKIKFNNIDVIETHLMLSTNTYFIKPETTKNLYNYFSNNGVKNHIDFDISTSKEYIKLNIYTLDKIIFENVNKFTSSMVESHNKKFLLNYVLEKNGELYKNLNTPVLQVNDSFPLTIYFFWIVVVFFIVITVLTFKYFNFKSIFSNLIFNSLWFILGLLLYDVFN